MYLKHIQNCVFIGVSMVIWYIRVEGISPLSDLQKINLRLF